MINFIYNQKNTFLAISAMVIGVIFIDIHGLIVKYLGGEYSTIQLALFRNTFAIIPLILLLIYNKESSDLFKNLNKIDLQEQNLKTVILLNPKNEEAIYNLAKLKLETSDYKKSKELNERLITLCNNFCSQGKKLKKEIEILSKK